MLNMGVMFRLGFSSVFGALAAAWSVSVLAAAQPVVVVELPGAPPELREKMRAAAESALAEAGVNVAAQKYVPVQEDCTTRACLVERGKRFGATHILEIQGTYANESYKLRLDVLAGNGGRVLGSDSKECEICSARDFLRAIKERSVTLWARVAREQAIAAQAQAEPGTTETSPVEVPLPPASRPEEPRRRSLWQQPWPLVGLGLALGGVVAMGFGGYYLAVDGEPSCPDDPECIYKRRTKRLGWELIGGGGAALVTGTILVVLGRDDDRSPKVALGPDRILVFGRF